MKGTAAIPFPQYRNTQAVSEDVLDLMTMGSFLPDIPDGNNYLPDIEGYNIFITQTNANLPIYED